MLIIKYLQYLRARYIYWINNWCWIHNTKKKFNRFIGYECPICYNTFFYEKTDRAEKMLDWARSIRDKQ